MSRAAHLAELERRHRALEAELVEARAHPSIDNLQIVELKRRKLLVKDEIARLQTLIGIRGGALSPAARIDRAAVWPAGAGSSPLPERLAALVRRLNAIAPNAQWRSATMAVVRKKLALRLETHKHPASARSRSCRKRDGFLVAITPGQHGPRLSCDLVGKRDRGHLGGPPRA
jgi:hypothetical protein